MAILQKQYLDELKMELESCQYHDHSDTSKLKDAEGPDAEDSLPNLKQIAEDAENMSKVLISRKKRKLLEAMEVIFSITLCCFNSGFVSLNFGFEIDTDIY